MDETTRPTFVDKKTYIKFANKCRTDNKDLRGVLNRLLDLYLDKGEKIFLE